MLPIRRGSAALQADCERLLLGTPHLRLLPTIQEVLREAARLRAATPGLRTPDSLLHAATALLIGCALVTNDARFRRVPHLSLAVLGDVLAA